MFFVLTKVLGFFAILSNLLIVLGLVGLLLLPTRFARAGCRLLVTSIVLIAMFGFSPLGNALLLPLEQRFPPWNSARGEPDGIVVLGGSLDDIVSPARDAVVLNEAAERLTATVALARRFPRARIIFSGGSASLLFERGTEAALAKRFFAEMGLPPERILFEDRSRNTSENAIFSKEMAKPQAGERWLLVTSAYHMPRAMGVFRHEGFLIEAYPVDWRMRGPADLVRPFERLSEGLRRNDLATREWVGLLAYWLTDRSSALFPAPSR